MSKRLMTEPPGKEPDIPARTSATGGHSTGQQPLSDEQLVSSRLADTFLRTLYLNFSKIMCKHVHILTINGLHKNHHHQPIFMEQK